MPIIVETNSQEIIEKGLGSLISLLEVMRDEQQEIDNQLVIGFIAGFQSGMKALGLGPVESIRIAKKMTDILHDMNKGESCGNCENCKVKQDK